MTFFLDTSVVFKLFVQEELSDHYLSVLEEDPSVYVSHISWVEFHSALRKRMEVNEMTLEQRENVLQRFKKDWNTYVKLRVDELILESAAHLVGKYSLKTLDSVQLATALELREQSEEPFVFLTADKRLETAARKEKLQTHV